MRMIYTSAAFLMAFCQLPVTAAGDYVCLDLARASRRRVAFWDKRHFWGTGEWREGDLYHVANSFEEFLASLRPNPY